MNEILTDCFKFNQPLDKWKLSIVEIIDDIFYNAKNFNLPETLKHFGICLCECKYHMFLLIFAINCV